MSSILNNSSALNAFRHLDQANKMYGKSLQKLSSGLRINNAFDDPAGLVISEKLRAQIKGLNQATLNTQDALSMIQTAEGALNEQANLLNQIRALALHAANTGVVGPDSIAADQAQVDEAVASIDRIATQADFAGKKLLDGTSGNKGIVVLGATLSSVVIGSTAPTGTNNVNTILTTAATRATLAGNVDRSAAVSGDHVVSVNGINITITNGSTQATVVNTLNSSFGANGLDLTAVANGVNIDIRNNKYGSAFKVSLVDGDNILNSADTASASGTDTAGTINGEAATGKGLELTANVGTSYAGTKITFQASATAATYNSAFQVVQGQLKFQVGANATDSVSASIGDLRANQLGVSAGGVTGLNSIKTGGTYALATNPGQALAVIDAAIADVSNARAKLGALGSYVLETQLNSISIAVENIQASESRIRDVDMAAETTNLTKHQILLQASTAMLAQANAAPQTVLRLLQQ
ncbi:MAG: flagellin [Elusimicrobiota bacterium]